MLEQVKLLSSRRAYEYRPDDLRLSTLSIKPVQEQIQRLFQFQSAVMGSPMPTFGEVPVTYPPGFVFNMGMWISEDKQIIPIRLLHFEQRRIVIDVAGPSSAIVAIFEHLLHFLSELQAPDGSFIVGESERILDQTVISAQFPFSMDAIFAPPLRNLFMRALDVNSSNEEFALVSTIVMQKHPEGQELSRPANPEESYTLTLGQRAGTKPEEHIYLSSAPLDSEAHLIYLSELEEILSTKLLR
jgi:hypothetical protein